jgi:hypothetical protein
MNMKAHFRRFNRLEFAQSLLSGLALPNNYNLYQ